MKDAIIDTGVEHFGSITCFAAYLSQRRLATTYASPMRTANEFGGQRRGDLIFCPVSRAN